MYTVKVNEKEYKVELDKKDKNKGKFNGQDFELDIIETKPDTFHLISDNKSYNIEIVDFNKDEKTVKLKINGEIYQTQVLDELDLLLKDLGMDAALTNKVNEIKAPMPGLVLDVLVSEGQEVKKGDNILILEAMKMENNIKSPTDGIVKEIKCNKGDAVEKNDVLVLFE